MYVCRYHYTRHTIQVRSGMRNRQYHLLGIVRVFVMRRSIINDLFMAISSTVPCFTVGRSVVPLLDSRLAREILNQIYLHKYYVLQGSLMAVLWLAGWLNERANEWLGNKDLPTTLLIWEEHSCLPAWLASCQINVAWWWNVWALAVVASQGVRGTVDNSNNQPLNTRSSQQDECVSVCE